MCESVHKCVHSFCFCFLLYFFLGGGGGGWLKPGTCVFLWFLGCKDCDVGLKNILD